MITSYFQIFLGKSGDFVANMIEKLFYDVTHLLVCQHLVAGDAQFFSVDALGYRQAAFGDYQ